MIARGVVEAAREVGVKVPLVVRLEGTNVEEGRRLLAESGLDLTVGDGWPMRREGCRRRGGKVRGER